MDNTKDSRPNIEREREELVSRMKTMLPEDMQEPLAVKLPDQLQQLPFEIKVSHVGSNDADTQ